MPRLSLSIVGIGNEVVMEWLRLNDDDGPRAAAFVASAETTTIGERDASRDVTWTTWVDDQNR